MKNFPEYKVKIKKKYAQDFLLFDLILYVPVNSFSVMLGWVCIEPVLSKDKRVLLKDTTQ